MKSLSEVLEDLKFWADREIVGNITFYHPPGKRQYGAYIEQTIKAREMDDETRKAFETLLENLGALKGEFHRDKDGRPDRVKITKAI
jgi:hypothetical protein